MINWLMVGGKNSGYGKHSIKMIEALWRKGVNVMPISHEVTLWPYALQQRAGYDKASPTIACVPPYRLYRKLPGRTFAFTMYEVDSLPPGWAETLNTMTERVIVPAPYWKTVFEDDGVKVPVHVVPEGIDPDEFPLVDWSQRPERPFTFLAIGDKEMRKGADVLWKAFYLAFGNYEQTPDVRLMLKVNPGPKNIFAHVDPTTSDPRVVIWHEDVDNMAEVYHQADCFVFPSRGEGWGLPPREAAACGVPTIATDHGGLSVGLVNWGWRLSVKSMSSSPMPGDGMWAEPDVDDLVKLMRGMYDERETTRDMAERGAKWLRTQQTWDHAADAMIKLLREVGVAGLQCMDDPPTISVMAERSIAGG